MNKIQISIASLAVTLATTATAQILSEHEYQKGPWEIVEIEAVAPCGYFGGLEAQYPFPVQVSYYEKYKLKKVSDRIIVHFQGHQILTNPANGRQSTNDWNSMLIYDFKKGLLYNPGRPVRITGDDGQIAMAAGRLVVNLETFEIERPYTGNQWPDSIAYPDLESDKQRLVCEDLLD
jgi:hypothetical protein